MKGRGEKLYMKFSDKDYDDKKLYKRNITETAAEAFTKHNFPVKLLTAALIALISIVFLNSVIESRDGRHSIISDEGSNEYIDHVRTEEEIRLENILACINGVGKVHVMIDDSDDNVAASASVFLSPLSNSSSRKSIDVSEKNGGVIVVAEGGGDPNVRSRITDAVSTVCGIKPSDVAVFELQD